MGLNTDNSVKENKGEERPINNLSLRLRVLSSVKFIDHILPFDEKTPIDLIKKINPDVLVKGSDYKINKIIGSEFVIKNGGKVKTIKLLKNHSSTSLINKAGYKK